MDWGCTLFEICPKRCPIGRTSFSPTADGGWMSLTWKWKQYSSSGYWDTPSRRVAQRHCRQLFCFCSCTNRNLVVLTKECASSPPSLATTARRCSSGDEFHDEREPFMRTMRLSQTSLSARPDLQEVQYKTGSKFPFK